jgi:FkbH-like protein
MTDGLYTGLAWLPRPPADFAAACKSLRSSAAPGAAARALAMHSLDQNQLARLGRAITRLTAEGESFSPLERFRLGLIGNGTLDLFVPIFVATAARHGIALDCVQGDYGQIMQEALDPGSRINAAKPDAVLLAIDYRGLPLQFRAGDSAAEVAEVDCAVGWLDSIREGIRRHSGALAIVQTVAAPPESLFGSLDCLVPGTPRRLIMRLNQAIAERIASTNDLLLDVARLAETVGLGVWHSSALWNMGKLPFDDSCLAIYADHLMRLLSAVRGRSRKCLVLDLDNTIWGGVIGDDGLEGIKTARGDATGEAHLAVQELALNLRKRGIVLAVSSKNTDEIARAPFREHPEMLLKEEHFAVFQANWNDKPTNIKAIAEELALGLDSMVFLDDNPVERALVRQVLPEVAVPELPDDPALYARTLAAAGYFESIAFSAEDRMRAEMYEANARRVSLKAQTGNLDAYLASLGMEISFAPFDRAGRARIGQLINKSNQFNLTTRRYSEAEVVAAEEDHDVFTLQVRLVDKFGDNGMISVVICRPGAPLAWDIDSWLMSCRVLGRKVEQAVLREILMHARESGIETLIGTYRPTEKNALVRDHYAELGFTKLEERRDGTTVWSLLTTSETSPPLMAVRRAGFAHGGAHTGCGNGAS